MNILSELVYNSQISLTAVHIYFFLDAAEYAKSNEDSEVKVITSSTPQKVAFAIYIFGLLFLTGLCVTLIFLI